MIKRATIVRIYNPALFPVRANDFLYLVVSFPSGEQTLVMIREREN